jgi:hypothetical protein
MPPLVAANGSVAITMMINTRTEFARDAAGGGANRPFAAPLVSWPGGTWPPSARSVREQADAPGRLPSLAATFRAHSLS